MREPLRWWCQTATLVAILFIAGCAHTTRATGQIDGDAPHWQGRLLLTVESQPVQAFSADFDLQGNAQTGTLAFFTPLGTTVARLQWSTEGAYLQASGETQRFESLDALTLHTAGAVLPVASLFAWLKGDALAAPGWRVDLHGLPEGRLQAQRMEPQPPARLKIILER